MSSIQQYGKGGFFQWSCCASDWDAWCSQGSHDDKSLNLGLLGGQEKHGLFDSGWDRKTSPKHTHNIWHTPLKNSDGTHKNGGLLHIVFWNTSFFIGWFFRFHLNFQGGITPNFQVESEIWSIPHRFSSRFFSLLGAPKRPFRWAVSEVAELPKIYVLPVVQIRQIDPEVPNFLGSEANTQISPITGWWQLTFFFSWCSKNVSISSWVATHIFSWFSPRKLRNDPIWLL